MERIWLQVTTKAEAIDVTGSETQMSKEELRDRARHEPPKNVFQCARVLGITFAAHLFCEHSRCN